MAVSHIHTNHHEQPTTHTTLTTTQTINTHSHTLPFTTKHSPIVTVAPLEKYTLVVESRIHSKYTPAVAPFAFTVSETLVELVNDDTTLVTADVGVPLQFPEITNPPASAATFTNPAPLTVNVCVTALAGITLGTTDVTDSKSNDPASKYGDTALHRTHSR